MRQALLDTLPVERPESVNKLIALCKITLNNSIPLAHVPPDSHHLPLTQDKKESPYGKSFVDDTGVAAYLNRMQQHLNNSVTSASGIFGAEGTNCRGDCLQDNKWSYKLEEIFLFLRF